MKIDFAPLIPVFGLFLFLQGCASAPRVERTTRTDVPLEISRDEDGAKISTYASRDAVRHVGVIGLPSVTIDPGSADQSVTEQQAALVANRAARDICNGIAPYLPFGAGEGTPEIRVMVRAIRATSTGTAGVSEAIGLFVPGPFRIPAGLGGFAADAEVTVAGAPVVVLQWSQGANPITEGARVSAIGDAYQLAGDFADDFVDIFLKARGTDGSRRKRLEASIIEANQNQCLAAFGKANAAGAGASFVIGLAPEAIDKGAPALKREVHEE